MSRKKLVTSRKKLILALVCGVLFVALLIAYFAIQPLLEVEETEVEPPELLPGEVLGTGNRIYMFPAVTRADMERIEVHNEHGTYAFYRAEDNQFYIEGKELSPYNLQLFSQLVVSTGTTLTLRRLENQGEDLSEYGLAEADNPDYYVLTKVNGEKHKVYVGAQIPTEGGYYCRYEGREAVYVMDATLGYTVKADIHSFLTPSLGYPVASNDFYQVDDLVIIKNGKVMCMLDRLTPEENGTEDTDQPNYSYELREPGEGFEPNLETYAQLLEILGSFAGDEVVAAGSELGEDPITLLQEKYGIVFFETGEEGDEKLDFEEQIKNCPFFMSYSVKDEPTMIFFSQPDEEGNMYAFSTVYWQVVKLNIKTATFIKWNLLDYVDPPIFSDYIYNCESITIRGQLENDDETIVVDEKFYISSEVNANGQQTVTGARPEGGDPYDNDTLTYFKRLYGILISMRFEDYTDLDDISKMTHLLSLTVVKVDGTEYQIEFYAYSTRRCYYTVNGDGQFWVARDHVEKLIRGTDRLVNGLPVDPDQRD